MLPETEDNPFDLPASEDWTARRSGRTDEFDIIIATLDPDFAESKLVVEFDGEHCATYQATGHKIYRINDARFAVICPPEAVKGKPNPGIEVWNWILETPTPAFMHVREKKRFDEHILGPSPDLASLSDFTPPFVR